MRDASSRLFQSLFDAYELDWEGGEDLGAVVEGEDLLWNDCETKLRDQALLTMESYMSQFPDIRERVAKRGRKLVDYDSSRHHLESLENAKKRDDIKIGKAKEEMKTAQKIFEEMNRELKEELPVLHDSRIGCYVTVFQAVSNLRDIFYREMAQNNQNLQNIMKDLKAQHPDKNFVIKNFSRCAPSSSSIGFNLLGSLKRRSLKDALSPRSLRASFSDFHMSYSPRGTLRREYNSSFRSDRGSFEPYSTETSPTKPKPIVGRKHGSRNTDTSSMSEDNSAVEASSSTAPVTDDTGSAHSATRKEVKPDNEGEEMKEEEPLPITDQGGERASPNLKDDSLEDDDENVLEPSVSHSERADPNASSTLETPENGTTHSEVLNEPDSGGMENGKASDHKLDLEASRASCKETARTDHKLGEVKEETV
ncbi:bridging integrator 2a isoform X3 [Colossoma macropomum]|nr:bridging integrator 2a isoform X3 [Colossoma macropomum]